MIDLFTTNEPFIGPNGEEMPESTSVRTRQTKWFGDFGVMVEDAYMIPAEDHPGFFRGPDPASVLRELDTWFDTDRVPATMKRPVLQPAAGPS